MISSASWCPLYAFNRVHIFRTEPFVLLMEKSPGQRHYKKLSAFPNAQIDKFPLYYIKDVIVVPFERKPDDW